MNIKLRRAKRRDAKERNWMFIVMPNDHLIYIAYNSASVLNMLLTLFLEHCSKPKNTVCTTFNFKERSFIVQLPPSTVCKFSSMIYLHPHILIHIYLEVIIALIYEPAMWWLIISSNVSLHHEPLECFEELALKTMCCAHTTPTLNVWLVQFHRCGYNSKAASLTFDL